MSQAANLQKESAGGQPSESALNVARCRAVAYHDPREAIRGPDYLAEVFLGEEAQQSLVNPAIHAAIRQKLAAVSPGGYEYFIARTAYLDEAVEEALRENIPQAVFLGAGYDTRAYRFADLIRDTRLFELDSPPTQAHKRSLLAEAGVAVPPALTFVPIDFNHESLPERLAQAGYDAAQKTLFIWEGVSYYLPPETVDEVLSAIRAHSAAGSILCMDYMLAPVEGEDRFGAAQSRAAMKAMYTFEPLYFDLAGEGVTAFLAERGFEVVEHLTTAMMEERYLTLEDGTLAGRSLDLFGLVKAVVMGHRG
jgi:methyltransferase (TIGR00027 family)